MARETLKPGRIVAIDHGTVRSGMAVSDSGRTFAFPVGVYYEEDAIFARVRALHAERPVAAVVVGLPLNMDDGSEGPQAREVRAFGDRLRAAVGLEIVFWDERLTSFAAEESLQGVRRRGRQGKEQIDVVAAQIILQEYLGALAQGR